MDQKTSDHQESIVNPVVISSAGKPSLFKRLGGADAISATVEQFYERVLADTNLEGFFLNTNLKRLKERQKRFFTQALGGPSVYNGRSMREAHERLSIEQQHFNSVAGHLVSTLAALGVPESLINETVELIAPLAAEIVNTPTTHSDAQHTQKS
jgi:hemoglobin